MTTSIKDFLASGRRNHMRTDPPRFKATAEGWSLTTAGLEHFSKRLEASARNQYGISGEALLALAAKAIRGDGFEFQVGADRFELVAVNPERDGTPKHAKRYLAPRYLKAGAAVSQAFYSALYVG